MSESTQTSTSQKASASENRRWFVTGNEGARVYFGGTIVLCFVMWFFMASVKFIGPDDVTVSVSGLARAFAVVAFMAAVWCAAFVRRGAPNAKYAAELAALASELLVPTPDPRTMKERVFDQNVRLRLKNNQFEEFADAVRRERDARAEWLASLPEGSCSNPPPQALLDAEEATGEALRAIEVAK